MRRPEQTGETQPRLSPGFTLVELLVVIVVIGILAAIAIPVFLSQADKASDASLKSDLTNAAKLLQVAEANGETLPSEITAGQVVDLGSAGTLSSTQTLTVSGSGETLCVEGVSDSGDTFSADLSEGVRNYDCDGNVNGVAPGLKYLDKTFTSGSNGEVLAPTISGGDGSALSFSVAGSLPDGVSFDTATGEFTGLAESEWNVDAATVDTGWTRTCVLTDAGGVKCWGWNGYGQLGIGAASSTGDPTDVVGLDSGVAMLYGGVTHVCALTDAGGVKCWGSNAHGQLGDGTTTDRNTPVDVVGLESGVTQIASGARHTCALTAAGGLKCWGDNQYYGQLGTGDTTSSLTPVDVVGLQSGVTQIDIGYHHGCAVTNEGAVKCWGTGRYYGSGDDRFTADEVPGLSSGITSVTAGLDHTCVLTDAGGVKCWGRNRAGQLGDGTTTNRYTPVDVLGLGSGVTSLVAGLSVGDSDQGYLGGHTCAILTDRTVKCWGRNDIGQLGNNTTSDSSTPVTVIGLTDVTDIAPSAGRTNNFTCAARTDGSVKCWGQNGYNVLGDGSGVASSVPVDTAGFGPQPGFPATLDVTVTDNGGSSTTPVTLTVS